MRNHRFSIIILGLFLSISFIACGGNSKVDLGQSVDTDKDTIIDDEDNCKSVANTDQADEDEDDVGNVCDNCPSTSNKDQKDTDADGVGDVCDNGDPGITDTDKDGIMDSSDNCSSIANADQKNSDKDKFGDVCDNCPTADNQDQKDSNSDKVGDACTDTDGDGKYDTQDNCPKNSNADQKDTDSDKVGDVCDNCVNNANTDQADADKDGIGDVCESVPPTDSDGDGIADSIDNCKDKSNVDQVDTDGDGIGNMCDDDSFFKADAYGCTSSNTFTLVSDGTKTNSDIQNALNTQINGSSKRCLKLSGNFNIKAQIDIGKSVVLFSDGNATLINNETDSSKSFRMISVNISVDTTTVRIGNLKLNGNRDTESIQSHSGGISIIVAESIDSTILIQNCIIVNHYYGGDGAGIFATVSSSKIDIVDNYLSKNTVDFSGNTNQSPNGGGIYAKSSGDVSQITIEDNIINQNTALDDENDALGGGLYVEAALKSAIYIKNNSITQNTAQSVSQYAYGGGISAKIDAENGTMIEIDQNDISGNNATSSNLSAIGGGINAIAKNAADISITNNSINNNKAESKEAASGGGIKAFVGGSSTIDIETNSINKNTATSSSSLETGGGIYGVIYGDNATLTITNDNTFSENAPDDKKISEL